MMQVHSTILLLLICLFFWGCGGDDRSGTEVGDQRNFSKEAAGKLPLLSHFLELHPSRIILKYAEADLDDDGRKDIIVIYRADGEKNQMSVIRNIAAAPVETNPLPAPISDQMIQFRNIDDTPPLEFILQGRKGAKVGYAIFRIEEGVLLDLFGDGMEDCC